MHKQMFKVVCPIERKDGGGTIWARLGNGHTNKDESINVYLDALPVNGRLQLRAYTEDELRERESRRAAYGGGDRTAAPPAV